LITPKITNLGYSNLWTDMSTILGYASNFQKLITKLFSNGEQGFAYDPNDLTTLYQDAAGTIPVTAAGQPVGLMKDKSGRNNHASQTASASRPILQRNATTGAYYLVFDGVDDFFITNSIDFTATDKVSLFTGVRKLSVVTSAVLLEFSENSGGINGTFALWSPLTALANYAGFSRGTVSSNAISPPNYTSPNSAVLSAKSQISTDVAILRANGIQVAQQSTDQGTGNYGKHPLYIGRRGGYGLAFNGHIYGLIGVGKLVSNNETASIEKVLAKRVGVTLNV
jgi:hypothetical protein